MFFVIGFVVLLVVILIVYLFGLWVYNDKDMAAGMTMCVGVILFIAYCCISFIIIATTPTVM